MSVRAYPVPPASTARRLIWPHLPPHLRAAIERRLGSQVVDAHSRNSGFTPGFASVLTCADGSRHFVKAASVKAQRLFAESYRTEARKLAGLPASTPAPRLEWVLDEDDWVALETAYVAGEAPQRPWRAEDLDSCLDALEEAARVLTPAPAGVELDALADELAAWPQMWDAIRLAGHEAEVAEAAALAAGFAAHVAGETLLHTDLRADNTLLTDDGAVFCDWNWPVRGAAWVDSLSLLIGPRGDGLDVEAVIAARPLLREVPAEAIDAVLALFTGYFLKSGADPVPPTSPHLREHQRWQGEVCWDWLCDRRGWA